MYINIVYPLKLSLIFAQLNHTKMIRFSNRVNYGLQFLLFLDVDTEDYSDIQRAALSCGIPYKFLEAIAVDLKKHGILDVKRGAGGGYKLARHSGEVFLSDVVMALEKTRPKPRPKEMEPIRKVVYETLDEATSGFWRLMQEISLRRLQQKYNENTEKVMYYI
jgi:Rrf2 family transcriptional regulator, cysteine metabolism repressor